MKKPNRLANETSPYLLQHAFNPVDWYPWSEEAFETAREKNRPVFISIGYSTCHWCHVMERESFEDEEIAAYLNENYVCIKVDREEHPDVDHYYMEACQLMTGRGGWPLSIFAAHSKKPFLTGTYFPKTSRNGRMGFRDILVRVLEVWNNNPESVLFNVNEIQQDLTRQLTFNNVSQFDISIFTKAYNHYRSSYDSEHGGFGNAPKFPAPHNLLFLLRYYYQYKDEYALNMVETTVKKICMGGVYDHIGSGFHRYSTDKKWLVPHFEKMLYDQAMMILVLTDLYKITHSYFYKYFLENTIEYVLTKLLSPDGGFYSAQDADSEGVEGKYYVWTYDELSRELSAEELFFVKKYFNIRENGNFFDEQSHTENGNNIFHFAGEYIEEFEEVIARFQSLREKLFSVRKERVPLILDNKILTDWNGLMIYALASASFTLNNKRILNAAKGAYSFILSNQCDCEKLHHSITNGKKNNNSILDDYAFMGLAGLGLFEVAGQSICLANAIRMAKFLNELFYDEEKHLFRLSENFFPDENYSMFDNAYPSGNSASFFFLSRLHHYTKDEVYLKSIMRLSENIPEIILTHPSSVSFLMQAFFNVHSDFREIIITYNNSDELAEVMDKLKMKYLPVITLTLINKGNIDIIAGKNSFFENFRPYLNGLNVFICDKNGCSLPAQYLDID